jgi:hypothetical protein
VSSTIVCISCVKSKRIYPCAAKDMYTSPLFRRMFLYAQQLRPQMIFILSAEYGLLKPDDVIAPYEKTLKTMKTSERSAWAGNVLLRLREEANLQEDKFIFLAGAPYRENLVRHIRHYEVPMEGLSFGRQLQWLTERVSA